MIIFTNLRGKKPEVLVRVSSIVGNHYRVQRIEDTAENILNMLKGLEQRGLVWNIDFLD
jgi:hypothetical protein